MSEANSLYAQSEADRQTLARQVSELTVLHDIGVAIACTLDLDKLLSQVLHLVTGRLPFDRAVILLVNKERAMLTGGRSLGGRPEVAAQVEGLEIPLLERGSALARAVLTLSSDDPAPEAASLLEIMQTSSLLVVPLQDTEHPLGVLAVGNATSDGPIALEGQDTLHMLGRSVAAAIENVRRFEAVGRRAQEAETLYQAGTVVAATLQREEAIERILEQLARVVPYDSASVQLLREDYLEIVGGRGWADPAAVVGQRFPVPGDNPNTTVIQQRQPHILSDAPAAYPAFREETSRHIRSWLGVPLILRDQVVGMLAVDSTQPDYFTADHARLATAFATQVAVALENARLYRSREELLQQAEMRAQEVDTLEQIARAVSSGLNLDTTLETIHQQVQRVMQVDAFFVALFDEHTRLVTYPLVYDQDQRYEESPFPLPPRGKLNQVLDTGQPLLINRTPEEVEAIVMRPETAIGDVQKPSASLLYVPLHLGSRLIGVMSVQSYRFNAYSQRDVTLLTGIASHAAIALENARLYDEAQQRVAELETLQRTSLQLASSLDLSAVLGTIAQGALSLVGATDCLIYLYDQESDSFSFGTALGRWAAGGSVRVPRRRGGLTAAVIRQGRPVVINDAVGHPLYAAPEAQAWDIQAIAGFPLQRAGRVLGVLHVVFVEPHAFSEEELRMLGLLADQAAIAIENARLFEAERAQLAELTVLHAVATAGAEATREGVLIERVTKIIGQTLYPANLFGVMLLDQEANVLHFHPSHQVAARREQIEAALGHLASDDAERVVIPLGKGIIGTVAASGQPWRVADVSREPVYIDAGVGTRSELCVPLKVGERVIGVINAESRQLDAFSEADERLLATAAGQLATAIEKVRLYEEAQREIAERVRAEEELRKHRDHLEELVNERTAALRKANTQLQQEIDERKRAEAERERLLATERAQARRQAALFRLSAELAATLDETEVCRRVVHGLRDTLGYDFLALYLVDETTGDRVHAASAGPVDPPTRIPSGHGLSERPLLDGQLQYTPDATQDPRYIYWMGGSEVDVPVRIGGKALGVLIVESKRRGAFSQDDFEVLTAAAYQAGLAIEKARLLAAERQRADELDALRTTMADITAELELSTLLQAIVERATGLLDAAGGELGLYDEASQEIRIVVSHNLDKDYVGTRQALGEGAMGRVAETGEPLIVADYHTWEGRAPQYADIHLHAGMAVPLEVGSRLVGAITIVDVNPFRQFSPADLHLLNLFAQQAAIAIENARLFGETERRVAELATLTEVGQALSSTLRVDEVVQLIYEQTRRVMYAESMIIMLYDQACHELECVFSNCPDDAVPGQRFPGDYGASGYMAKHRNSVLLRSNVVEEARELGIEVKGRPSASFLGVPMLRGERVLGVIILQHYTTPNVYDESHQALLETIASQAAIAIENAHLYDQAQREIAERKRAEAELRRYQEHLEDLVQERTSELRASEERYRTLFDGVPVGLYRSTPAGKMVDANLALMQMFGYPSREDILAVNPASFYVDPQDRVRWQALMEREGVVRDFESQGRRHDGTVIWLNDSARAVKDEQGQVLYYEGSLEDITERKRAEAELRKYQEHLEDLVEERTAELRESEERYRTLFDGVPVGLYRSTPSGQVLDANLATAQMLGFPNREEALQTVNTADVYVDPKERVRWQALMEREGVVRDFEQRMRRHDGTIIWLSDSARAVKDEQGQVLYYEGSMEDITERKRFEQEIRRQKDYFEALFVNSPVAVVTADLDLNVVSWNPAAEKLFGYTQEEVIGQNLDDLVASDPRVRQEALNYTAQVSAIGRAQGTTKRVRKDGSLVDVEVLALPVIVGEQKVGYIAIYIDITDLQKARRAAEAANQAKSAFLANMSHELRTPLNAILGFTQLMTRDPGLTADHQENLDIISHSGEHLLALINDVLEMSKIEAGRVTLQEKSFDLHNLLDGLEGIFGLRARDKGLTLSFERAESVPRYVQSDEGKLRQVLSNLLGNAVKFTHQGRVVLRVTAPSPALPGTQGRETLHVEVQDTGPGIAPEELTVIFDPFVQAAGVQQSYEGTGLGLSISRQHVRLMGGDLTVSSELGQGSVFSFDVQVGPADAAEVQAAQPRRRVRGLEPDGPIYRLLVAEDKDTNRQLLVKLLERLGFEVQAVVNGQEAIEAWERWEPHLIWMDMRMPVVDGYEATRKIKAMDKGQATVIIALTASAFEEDRDRMLSHGCDDFVRKPFREDEIFDMLAKHLGVRFVYEEEQAQPAPAQPPGTAAPLADMIDAASLTAALAALPAGWAADLQEATVKADLNRILSLIDQAHEHNPTLADALADLAHNFEYKQILTLIEQAGG
jgi:PAS domain S-box-containing protein